MQCIDSVTGAPYSGRMAPSDTKAAMLDVAERLLGTQGVDAMSMRDVATQSGQKNASAVQYHFGGRDRLLVEVFRRRMALIAKDRRAILDELDAAGRGEDVRALVEAAILPFAASVGRSPDGVNYAEFIVRLLPEVDYSSIDPDPSADANQDVHRRLVAGLRELPASVAAARVEMALDMAFPAIAMHAKRRMLGTISTARTFDDYVDNLIDMIVAALTARADLPSHRIEWT